MSTVAADPFKDFKQRQREGWKFFAPLETFTTSAAGQLVRFAGIQPGQDVLDVGTGTGVAAITARRQGAKVWGLDLTPELLVRARENADIAHVSDIDWKEGDAESLPYEDATFDVVMSQFGHMFAPRPEVAVSEMLRVLKPGGRIAFATWPPALLTGQMFALVGRYMPPPPNPPPAPGLWGDPAVVRERLGNNVRDLVFASGTILFPVLSPQHFRYNMETTAGPVLKLIEMLAGDQAQLSAFRKEMETIVVPYMADNMVRQDFLLTRATKS